MCNPFSILFLLGLQQKQQPYKEKDTCSSPKFITPLMDRSVIAGYRAAISCAVRGQPKVSVSIVPDYINPFTHAVASKPIKQQCTLFLILFCSPPSQRLYG